MQWNYLTKLYKVCFWRKKNGFCPIAKKGEAICGGELVNFFADKKHKNCGCAFVFLMNNSYGVKFSYTVLF